jgi:capsular exopolysaccharide synthesis family protein
VPDRRAGAPLLIRADVSDPLGRPLAASAAPEGSDARRSVLSALRFLGRRWWVLALVGGGLFYAATRYVETLPRTYSNQPAVLEILTDVPAGARTYTDYENAVWSTSYYVVPTQKAVLATRAILGPVVERLGLAGDPRYGSLAGAVVATSRENTGLIELTVRGPDPEMNAKIANAIAEEYARQRKEQRQGYLRRLLEAADLKMKAAEKALRESEDAIQAWKVQKGVSDVTADEDKLRIRLGSVDKDYFDAQAERMEADEAAAQVAAARKERRPLSDVAAVRASGDVRDALAELRRLEDRRRELEIDRQATRDAVTEATAREQRQRREVESLVETRAGEVEIAAAQAAQREAAYRKRYEEKEAELSRVVALGLEHERLLLDQSRAREALTTARDERADAFEGLSATGDAVRIWGQAQPSYAPVAPNLKVLYAGAAIVSLVLALGAALLLDLTSTRLRDPTEIARVAETPFLGVVPLIKATRDQPEPSRRVLEETDGDASEAYRLIAASATLHGGEGQAPKTFVVTSPQPGDGKTTTAVGFAMAMARRGKSVLLVDADLRKPSLHRVLQTDAEPGLTTLFAGRPVWGAVRTIEVASGADVVRFDVLTAGVLPPNPADLLAGPTMRQFVHDARARYDAVVIDTPPVNLASDASLLGEATDGVILVIRDSRTHRGMLHRAVGRLRSVRSNVRGVLLNAIRGRGGRKYGYGDYAYGYRYGYGAAGSGGNGRAGRPAAPTPATIRIVSRTGSAPEAKPEPSPRA